MNTNDYVEADKLCETIVKDFDVLVEKESWLSKYKSLYNRFNIQPAGLPAIADCHYEGIKYEHISEFHTLYFSIEKDSK